MSVAMSVGESDGGKAVAMWLWPCGCGHKSAWRFEREWVHWVAAM